MLGTCIDSADIHWETWKDSNFAAITKVQWKLIFSKERTPKGVMSMGLAKIDPNGVLPRHHHAPAELYHVLDGAGKIEIEGTSHVTTH
jgi:quercetin dioxygenase-like cupin family protein